MRSVFRHVCLFHLRAAADEELLARLEEFACRFRTDFPEIEVYRFERNCSPKGERYPLVLYSEFADEPAFRRYLASALHGEIASFLAPLVEETLIADFTL